MWITVPTICRNFFLTEEGIKAVLFGTTVKNIYNEFAEMKEMFKVLYLKVGKMLVP